jgi:hypothetical protein
VPWAEIEFFEDDVARGQNREMRFCPPYNPSRAIIGAG